MKPWWGIPEAWRDWGGGDGASQYASIVANGNQVLHFHKNYDFELNYDMEFVMFLFPFLALSYLALAQT